MKAKGGVKMDYELIFSDRKTVSLTIREGNLVVRAPRKTPKKTVEAIIEKHRSWIDRKILEYERKKARLPEPSESEIKELKREAKEYFTRRTEEISRDTGLKYNNVKITSAEKRFGSCNSKGNICFSYRLMLYPEAAREYVILHELAHTKEMNHSKRFYSIIERFMPDYKARKRLLK